MSGHVVFKLKRGTVIAFVPKGAKKETEPVDAEVVGYLARDDGNYYQLQIGEKKPVFALCSEVNKDI